MNGLVNLLSQPVAQQTVLVTMVVSAFIVALPKPGTPPTWGLLYKFFYDWVAGFWSLKTGTKPDIPPMSGVVHTDATFQTEPQPPTK